MCSKLSDIETRVFNLVSAYLQVRPDWLYAEINFESSWNPAAKNVISGARGLIQFMPATARGLGYAGADDLVDKYPDVCSQLVGPVYSFLKGFAPFPTAQSLCMAVFMPSYRQVAPDTLFPHIVCVENPNITCPGDYMRLVFGPAWESVV